MRYILETILLIKAAYFEYIYICFKLLMLGDIIYSMLNILFDIRSKSISFSI